MGNAGCVSTSQNLDLTLRPRDVHASRTIVRDRIEELCLVMSGQQLSLMRLLPLYGGHSVPAVKSHDTE